MAPSVRISQVVKNLVLLKSMYTGTGNMAAASQISSSSLAKLRKMTGYSVSNCKKALEMYANDIEQAQAWLHEEAKRQGWAKIANLQRRPVPQGLVAVCSRDSVGAMVEVNCETDFVARNAEFQSFVTKVLSSCLNYSLDQTLNEDCRKLHLNGESLNNLKFDSCTLGDLTASAIGKFGERTVIRRAVCFKTGNGVKLSSFSHPVALCAELTGGTFGKYGGLLAYRHTDLLPEMNTGALHEFGQQLCQHIVGMNPQTLGNMEDAIKSKEAAILQENCVKKVEVEDRKEDIIIGEAKPDAETVEEQDEEDRHDEEKLMDSNETRLLLQQFLLDPTMNVGQFLIQNSLEVIDFQRFECGEPDADTNNDSS